MKETDELEKQFDDAVMNAVTEGEKLGYSASYYLQKRARDGPMVTAHRLLKDKQISYGLCKLKSMHRLDLSLEAIVYNNPRFHPLFPQAIIDRCKDKLTTLDYFKKT
jgi:hypothetical protein